VRTGLELLLIVATALVALWPARSRVHEIVAALPRRYAASSVAMVVLVLAGHAISRQADTYPLTEWDMYTTSNPDDPQFVDYMAVLPRGSEERILIGQLFPSGGRHLRARIDVAALALRESRGGQAQSQLDSMLFAITGAWSARHPSDSLLAIRVMLGRVPVRNYRGPASIIRTLLYEYHPL